MTHLIYLNNDVDQQDIISEIRLFKSEKITYLSWWEIHVEFLISKYFQTKDDSCLLYTFPFSSCFLKFSAFFCRLYILIILSLFMILVHSGILEVATCYLGYFFSDNVHPLNDRDSPLIGFDKEVWTLLQYHCQNANFNPREHPSKTTQSSVHQKNRGFQIVSHVK